MSAAAHGRAHAVDELLGDARRTLGRGVGQEDEEFVAAATRERVAVAQTLGEPLPHELEHFVAGGMAERIVDDLETIEVHEEDAQGRVAALGLGESVGEAILEEEPVRKTGETVVEGHVLDLVFLALAVDGLGDVVRHVAQQVAIGFGVSHVLPIALDDEDAEGRLRGGSGARRSSSPRKGRRPARPGRARHSSPLR